jgi:hypothetical protein
MQKGAARARLKDREMLEAMIGAWSQTAGRHGSLWLGSRAAATLAGSEKAASSVAV